ncbi:DNA repair protein RecO [Bosea sp. PAMC 26642]|uniref:DNA repair protein RecO n=1 Tax=Bosea sp. (strain PAMC 26642) TaxID=1792307 RepID=UPI0007701020|nr:DNA repair protein RecO [Bosea sp. PAMC 26642]AMJ59516.1 DNA repair protein RecO [Bosea sp. PAMC 26642]
MEWTDQGTIIGARQHGENSVILEVMTAGHGRHLGLVRGGRSSKQQPVLQPGNAVLLTWRARLDEHLGEYKVELLRSHAARLIEAPVALYGLATIAALLRLLPERDPHPALHEGLTVLIQHLDELGLAPALVVRFEIAMLAELGFGLDLTRCAVTGSPDDLSHVSPKSGKAVSRKEAAPYLDRLLPLPAFLSEGQGARAPGAADIAAGFALTGFFLRRYVLEPRGLGEPPERARLVEIAARASLASEV